MAITFPASPTDGQQFTVGARKWIYSTAKGAWLGGTSSIEVGNITGIGTGVAAALANAANATGGIVLAGGTSTLNVNGTVGATTPAAGAFTSLLLGKTITASGTTGAQTINKSSGSVNFAAAATSVVVTNSLATVNSVIVVSKGTNDATARLGAAVAAAGSFTIHMDVAPAAETRVNFILTN